MSIYNRQSSIVNLVIVGAGPAGLAAAVAASEAGCTVALLDSGARPGGQYYRQTPREFAAKNPGALHTDFTKAANLFARVENSPNVRYLAETSVWTLHALPGGFRLHLSGNDSLAHLDAEKILLAPGAYDRALPFPGWDLPGVMTAGAAQTLVKSQRVLPGRRIVLSGAGPFLLPVAVALAQGGANIVGIYEATSPLGWAKYAAQTRQNFDKLREGGGYARLLAKYKIPYKFGRAVIRAEGSEQVERVTVARLNADWYPVAGSHEIIEADTLAIGYGFLPSTELAGLLGCETVYDATGAAFFVRHDAGQQTSVPGVFAAGEITGIGGSAVALPQGTIAGLSVAHELGKLSQADYAAKSLRYRQELLARRRFAVALNAMFRVRPGWQSWLTPDTTICRCEEVDYNTVRKAIGEYGARDAKTVKLTTRCGMGLCQGRVCGHIVTALTAVQTGRNPAEVGAFLNRPIAKTVTLGELAIGVTNPSHN
jgi:D-hydroxyproline dehydrogenase subunit alpha